MTSFVYFALNEGRDVSLLSGGVLVNFPEAEAEAQCRIKDEEGDE